MFSTLSPSTSDRLGPGKLRRLHAHDRSITLDEWAPRLVAPAAANLTSLMRGHTIAADDSRLQNS